MFFDRPESGELAILVHIDFDFEAQRDDPREFEELALSAGADPIELIEGQRHKPDPKFFVGTGKMEEIRALLSNTKLNWCCLTTAFLHLKSET